MRLKDKKQKQKKWEIEKCPWEGRYLNWPNGQRKGKKFWRKAPKKKGKQKIYTYIYIYFKTRPNSNSPATTVYNNDGSIARLFMLNT